MSEQTIKDKYWIKPGMSVTHKDHEGMIMTVDKIVKTKNKEGALYTKGVDCHWLDEHGGYQSGMFHTSELKEYQS